jgi:hypothetical protein
MIGISWVAAEEGPSSLGVSYFDFRREMLELTRREHRSWGGWTNKQTSQQALLVVVCVLLWFGGLGVWGRPRFMWRHRVCVTAVTVQPLFTSPQPWLLLNRGTEDRVAVWDTTVQKTRKLERLAEAVLFQDQFVQHVNRPGIEPGVLSVVLFPTVLSRSFLLPFFPSFSYIYPLLNIIALKGHF